jgi:hypothetical protein
LVAPSCRRLGRGVVNEGTEGWGFRLRDALGAFGVVWVTPSPVGRGGLAGRNDFRGLAWEGLATPARSLVDSCFAVTPMYLLAREPAEILDCAIIDASADDTLR